MVSIVRYWIVTRACWSFNHIRLGCEDVRGGRGFFPTNHSSPRMCRCVVGKVGTIIGRDMWGRMEGTTAVCLTTTRDLIGRG